MRLSRLSLVCASSVVLLAAGQQSDQKKPAPAKPQRETIARPQSAKQAKRNEDKLRKELMTPYRKWLNEQVIELSSLPAGTIPAGCDAETLKTRLRSFGYTLETVNMLLKPMVETSITAPGPRAARQVRASRPGACGCRRSRR